MSEHKYLVEISPEQGVGIPRINTYFGRITVLLGSNGTGKSRALKRIRDLVPNFGEPRRPVVYIEGGRVITIPNTIGLEQGTFNEYGTYERATQTFIGRRLSPISSRVKDAFYVLERKQTQIKIRHSEAVTQWQATGAQGDCPVVEENPLENLFKMFSEVFPEITISVEGENKQIICIKHGQRYSTPELSDGERQVLFVLADIALNADPNSLILADEPELNLHPQLAHRLWQTIEDRFPEAVFVYATHSISFAMRPSVVKVIVLNGRAEQAMLVDSVAEIPPEDLREFLGAIPAILAAPAAIAVEGEETSFDSGFYRWLLNRPDIEIVPLGGSNDVIAATTRTGVWDRLASSVRLAGIIDCDYRDESTLNIKDNSCIVLEYHEAESYLCHPEILTAIAKALGTADPIPTKDTITEYIFNYFEREILRIAANRMSYRAHLRLNVSLQSATFRYANEEEKLKEFIRTEADKEAAKASPHIGGEAALRIFNEELERCRAVLEQKDIDAVLRLVPGKELLSRLAPCTGCKDTAAVARAAFKHLNITDFEKLKSLDERIKQALRI